MLCFMGVLRRTINDRVGKVSVKTGIPPVQGKVQRNWTWLELLLGTKHFGPTSSL